MSGTHELRSNMLGIGRIQCSRLPGFRNTAASLHGHEETDIPEEEYDQLPLVTNVPEYCWAKEEEVNREQTSWTIQLEEKRNRFEESLKCRNQV
ncbi:uncharacterized protein PAC_08231 [Phialocephala subalpina]|uniref:Uncharacterized protein n=1 Tax=Phialocephala subalpina TaxID=576137 RepID=A0A1L7WZZ1_9HELO|nr:uncharacterized protein PAC_08231 [Phialocephala subalpina]